MSKNNLKKRKRGFINCDVCTMSGDIKISVRKDGREGGRKEYSQKLEEGGIISPFAIWDLRLGRMACLGTVKRSEPCTDTSIAISSLGPSGDIALKVSLKAEGEASARSRLKCGLCHS